MKTMTELVEFYISKGHANGLITALIKGVRNDGIDSSDDDSGNGKYLSSV